MSMTLPRDDLEVLVPQDGDMRAAVLAIPGTGDVADRLAHRALLADRLRWMLGEEDDPDEAAMEASARLTEAGFAPYQMDAEELIGWILSTDDLPSMSSAELPLRRATDQDAALAHMQDTTIEEWAANQVERDLEY